MDKALIAIGVFLVVVAIRDEQIEALETGALIWTEPGFKGYMLIYAGLLTAVNYMPKSSGVFASMASIMALGLWNKYAPKEA